MNIKELIKEQMEYLLEMGQMINIKSFANFIREDLDVMDEIAKELINE